MKCSQCKEKLTEFIEGNLSAEADEELKEHIINCQSCKEAYNKELLEYEAFKAAFSTEEVSFQSITPRVMMTIDKNKYSGEKKIFKKRYVGAIVAAIFLCTAISPLVMRYLNNGMSFQSTSSEDTTVAKAKTSIPESAQDEDTSKFSMDEPSQSENKDSENIDIDIDTVNNTDNTKNIETEEVKISPNANVVSLYSMLQVDNNTSINFNTPYIPTNNGVYEATIEGKGTNAIEEGVGVIYVKNTVENKINEFKLRNPQSQQSPIAINWYDETHLMVVQGLGFGTLVNGVDIVIINVETGEQMLIATASSTKRYRSVTRDGNSLVIGITQYVDETMNEFVDSEQRVENYVLGDIIE